jgi:hypothetical protein
VTIPNPEPIFRTETRVTVGIKKKAPICTYLIHLNLGKLLKLFILFVL